MKERRLIKIIVLEGKVIFEINNKKDGPPLPWEIYIYGSEERKMERMSSCLVDHEKASQDRIGYCIRK